VDSKQGHHLLPSLKPTRREILKAAATGAIGLGAASAFGPLAAEAASPKRKPGAPQTIKLMSWFQYEPGRKEAWKSLMDKFNAAQKDYKVVFVGWPFTNFATNVLVQLGSGGLQADLVNAPPDLAYRLVQADALAPIDDVITKLGVHPNKGHDFLRKNGCLHGFSIVEVDFAIIYNTDVFRKAGITHPPRTISEWNSQIVHLTNTGKNRYGIFQPNGLNVVADWWFTLQEYALAYDGVFAKGKKPLVNSAPIIKAMELWKTQYAYMPHGLSQDQSIRLFDTGGIAQELIVSAAANVLKSTAAAEFPYFRSVAPPWPSKKSLSRLHPLSIVAGTPHMDGAKAFVEFMARPENSAQLMEKCLDVIPPFPEVLKAPGVKGYLDSLPWAKGYLSINPVTPMDIMGDFIGHNDEFGQILLTNFQQSLTSNVTVEQAMNTAQTQLEALGSRVFK